MSTKQTKKKSKKPSKHQSPWRSFENVEAHVILKGIGAVDQSDSDENDNLSNYTSEAVGNFAREYVRDNVDSDSNFPSETLNELEYKVVEVVGPAIEDNVQSSMFKQVLHAAQTALDEALTRAEVAHDIYVNTDKGLFDIEVSRVDIVRAWERATNGQGYVAWDDTLTADDISGIDGLLSILRDLDEVYGRGDMAKTYRYQMDGFEPDTGNYSKLCKIVDPQWKKILAWAARS